MNSQNNQELALWDTMIENQNLSEALEMPTLEDEKFLNFEAMNNPMSDIRRELATKRTTTKTSKTT